MSFCKICICGEKVVFEHRLSFPDNCPSCGRKLVEFITYNEEDPRVEELLRQTQSSNEQIPSNGLQVSESEKTAKNYALVFADGKKIRIPDGECIVGRTGTGAEELAEYPSVSRQHLRIIVKRNIGILVEDLSSYGTLINGKRIQKNSLVMVDEDSTITLCDVETTLTSKETDNR